MSLSTQRERDYVQVAKEREKSPVKIYMNYTGMDLSMLCLSWVIYHWPWTLYSSPPSSILGLNTSCLAWENQTKYLAETKRYTVLIFENRGMGLSGIESIQIRIIPTHTPSLHA